MNIEEKRKKIREGIAITICEDGGDTWDLAPENYKEDYRMCADRILRDLQSEGVEIVDKDAELREDSHIWFDDELGASGRFGYRLAQDDAKKENFHKTYPLIGEE